MNSPRFKWIYAQANLVYRGALHVFSKLLFWRQKQGLTQFRENYIPEGLPPFSAAHREIAHQPGRCTTCSFCDSACPMTLSPMRLVISGYSGGPLLPHIAGSLKIMTSADCSECRACEKACPEGIPIIDLARFYQIQLKDLISSKSAS